jgi:hypothetical protein
VISGGNYAILNKGDVDQNSGNNVDASSSNTANQSNNQSNSAGQSQTVAGGGSCCPKDSGVSQSADQSNSGSNHAYQSAYSAPLVISGPNVAIANGWGRDSCDQCGGDGGTVNQNSGNWVYAPASNSATQTNYQTNALGQSQRVHSSGRGACCPRRDCHPCEPSCDSGCDTRCEHNPCEPRWDAIRTREWGVI